MKIVIPILLLLAWGPALYVAWFICPAHLKLMNEFSVSVDLSTALLLTHAWWLTPLLAVGLVGLASWKPALATRLVAFVAAIIAAVVPVSLALYYLHEIIYQMAK